MPKREENTTFQQRLRSWWETDTAKAVATIIAVLLIPASVIAWNYATNRANDIRNRLDIEGTSSSNNIGDTSNDESVESDEEGTEQDQNNEGQAPANANGDSQPAVGGLGSVQTLPNTDSTEDYTVIKGDNVYRISMKVCGNESYYKSNVERDYLKVGQTIRVTCN